MLLERACSTIDMAETNLHLLSLYRRDRDPAPKRTACLNAIENDKARLQSLVVRGIEQHLVAPPTLQPKQFLVSLLAMMDEALTLGAWYIDVRGDDLDFSKRDAQLDDLKCRLCDAARWLKNLWQTARAQDDGLAIRAAIPVKKKASSLTEKRTNARNKWVSGPTLRRSLPFSEAESITLR